MNSQNGGIKMERIKKIVEIIVFFFIVTIPLILTDWKGGSYSPSEQRMLAEFPVQYDNTTGKLETSQSNIENWISDNIGFRSLFVKLATNLKYNVFRQSASEKVLIGRDGWLFFNQDNNIELATGDVVFSESELETIAYNQQQISNWYKSRGINYVLWLSPSKATVYTEYLPMSDNVVSITPVDIVADYIREHTDVIVYNSKDILMEAKNNGLGQLYHKTDSHWNQRGSYYAYQGLHKVMKDSGILYDDPVSATFVVGTHKGEFSAMLGDEDLLKPEEAPIAEFIQNSYQLTSGELYNRVIDIKNRMGTPGFGAEIFLNSSNNGCLEIYGDSMTASAWSVPQYLAEHFGRVIYFPIRNVSIESDSVAEPDTVVFHCAERLLKSYMLPHGNVPYPEDYLYHGAEYIGADFDGTNVTVTVKNTSEFEWTRYKGINCHLRINGEDVGIRAYIPENVTVAVGETITFTFENVGEIYSNANTVDVQMLREGIRYFDQYLVIKD